MRKGHFHGNGKVYYRLLIRSGLPYIQHRIADFKCKVRLGTGKALGGLFKTEISLLLISIFLEELCAFYGNADNLFLGFSENLLSLSNGGGII